MRSITPLDYNPESRDRERRLHSNDPESEETGPYKGIGSEFSARRHQAGLDVTHVATSLRIRREHLAAIEDGRFGDLPAPAYAVGFVRSYAEFLGLDAAAAVQAYKNEAENSRERVSLILPTAEAEDRVPRGWLLGMSAFLVLVIFGAWFNSENSDLFFLERVSPAPGRTTDQLAAPIPVPEVDVAAMPEVEDVSFAAGVEAALLEDAPGGAPDGGAAEAPADLTVGRVLGVIPVDPDEVGALAVNDVAVGDALPMPAPGQNVDALPTVEGLLRETPELVPLPQLVPIPTPAADVVNNIPVAPAASPAAAPTPAAPAAMPAPAVPPAAPQVSGLPGVDPQTFGEKVAGRVVIVALQDSWVQITGNAGELLLTQILRAGDRYLAPDREDLILMTGNAGALEIMVDGIQIASLGPVGTVRRNVSLAPDRLLAGGR
jgi:cytoskeleton protein RodZ